MKEEDMKKQCKKRERQSEIKRAFCKEQEIEKELESSD